MSQDTVPLAERRRPFMRFRLPGRLAHLVVRSVRRVAPALGPPLQRRLIRAGYGVISSRIRGGDDVTFLNFGYAALDRNGTYITVPAEDQHDVYAIQLYDRVTGGSDLRGKDVLEVGCGRGGGSSFVARHLQPRTMTGLDFAPAAIRFCRRRHRHDGLTFVEGNAEDLPFPAESFDVVMNVESSHCYPAFARFVREVGRVLRNGGQFLFADVRPANQVASMREQLQEVFTIVDEERITANVLRALELDTARRDALIRQQAPAILRPSLRNLAAVEGTPAFEAFRHGELEYVRLSLRKS